MRKPRIIEHISLDQVSGEEGDFPYGDWKAPYRAPARGLASLTCSSAILPSGSDRGFCMRNARGNVLLFCRSAS